MKTMVQNADSLPRSPLIARGNLRVCRVSKQTGERECVWEKHNVLVDRFFINMLDLLDQPPGATPTYGRIASMWIESDNVGLPAADATDVGPHASSTVMLQYVFAPEDRTRVSVNTSIGPLDGLQLRATVDGDLYAGSQIVAAGLYTRGSADVPPAFGAWTPGFQSVHLVARQLVGPMTITAGFVFELGWTIGLGRLPEELL